MCSEFKNGKGIDANDNLYHQTPRNSLRCHSNEEKHKAEDSVGPTELDKSEARPNKKSSPFRSTNGTGADFNSKFENEPNPEIEKIIKTCKNNRNIRTRRRKS